MTSLAPLTLRELRVRAVQAPLRLPLQTSGGTVRVAPLALIDLVTEEGVTGRAYLFCYTPLALKPVVQLLQNLSEFLKGDAVAPLDIDQKLQRTFRLLGATGLTAIAMAGIDMAAWDAQARAAEVPLVRLLGGTPRPVPAYNSCGLGIIGAARAAAEAVELVAPGFRAVKVRLGYPDLATDVEVVRAVRRAIGEGIELMSDYNQTLERGRGVASLRSAARRRPGLDRGADCAPTTTTAMRRSAASRACRSRSARTGGVRTTWPRASPPARAISACPTR